MSERLKITKRTEDLVTGEVAEESVWFDLLDAYKKIVALESQVALLEGKLKHHMADMDSHNFIIGPKRELYR